MSSSSAWSVLAALAAANKLPHSDGFARGLSDTKVKAAKPDGKPAKIADGGGLTLYIPVTGKRVWHYRYRIAGKERVFTIGSYPQISLTDARTMHRAARWLVERNIHPKTYVDAEIKAADEAAAAARAATFRTVCEEWQGATTKSLAPQTVKDRREMLARHVLPVIGDVPITAVTRKSLVELLTTIDAKVVVTGERCRGYLRQIFDYATDREIVVGNPVPNSKVLLNAQNRKATPRKALPVRRVGKLLHQLAVSDKAELPTKLALRLLILTWLRTANVVGARWCDIDVEERVWRIPAERMKGRIEHAVWLSAQAVSVIKEVAAISPPDKNEYLFPNARGGRGHMGRMTLNGCMKRHGWKNVADVHGFRATASTWANEEHVAEPDVIETALAHQEKDPVRAAYNRALYKRQLVQLWQAWADNVEQLELAAASESATVAAASIGDHNNLGVETEH
ncbi:MAG TPA: integrase arm-type DNA-binding domain-containing protein [Rhodocyclaceae bacterium]|nr:integrase arm-type DNA-binding domain-containing protein [Rhodocyclaceae bacterium]